MSCFTIAAVALHVASQHSAPGYNNVNPGLSIRTECGIIAGAYYNSQRRPSAYIGYSYQPEKLPVFAAVALTTGYRHPKTGKSFAVAPIPMVGVRAPIGDHFGFRLGWIPKIRPSNSHVGHLMVEYRF